MKQPILKNKEDKNGGGRVSWNTMCECVYNVSTLNTVLIEIHSA